MANNGFLRRGERGDKMNPWPKIGVFRLTVGGLLPIIAATTLVINGLHSPPSPGGFCVSELGGTS